MRLPGTAFCQPVLRWLSLVFFSFDGCFSPCRSRLAILVCLRKKTATRQSTLDVPTTSANPDMFSGFSENKKGTQNGRISTRRSFPLRQQSEPTSFGAARGASTSQGIVTFRADPPTLHKFESADMDCIKKARRSKNFRVARVTGCEGIGATLEAFACPPHNCSKRQKEGSRKSKCQANI